VRKKRERHQQTSERALRDLEAFMIAEGERQTAVSGVEEKRA
jgi:hypothetical protein